MGTEPNDATQPVTRDPITRARAVGYSEEDIAAVPPESILGMGCGNPVAIASLREGEVVLDLGCGGGFDAFLAASKVGPTGRVIGVDASDEMLGIARAAAARRGCTNVESLLGTIEDLPLPDGSVDVVISNCVISDVTDRAAAFGEAGRVLGPGGRAIIADLVLIADPPDDLSGIPEVWAAWVAHAPRRDEYLDLMADSRLWAGGLVKEGAYSSPGMPEELAGRIASILVRARRQ